jgi:tyrosinase
MAVGSPSPRHPAVPIRFRRRVGELSPDQLALLRQAFAAVMELPDRDDRGYQFWAGIHGLPLPAYCQHGTPTFLPWHRAYLYFFERALRDRVPEAMLTWWDWRRPTDASPGRMPTAYTRKTVDRKPNPLFSSRVNERAIQQARRARPPIDLPDRTLRDPGRATFPDGTPITLPTVADVTWVLGFSDFLEFSEQLESFHNGVHVWVGGHMGEVPLAAYDPIFWAHHTMIDRIWRRWQLKHNGSQPPASLMGEVLEPFKMTVAQTLDPTTLGYDYVFASRSARMAAA